MEHYCIIYSKMVHCEVTLETSFVQCWNREYRMVNKTMLLNSACIIPLRTNVNLFVCLFGVLRRFQHCTGHITMGSWKGRGNQYIEFARVVYCKLPTNGKQLPAFPLTAMTDRSPAAEVGGESVTTLPPWPLVQM